ncbi:hypothetical protein N0V90_013328 [Kalmusia sp. IMI 367209]|nr:hypothetical protein N0V90_013328 [Kalmusia sp. IMI 367209]
MATVPGSPSASKKVELFVPAPEDTTREVSFRWHITTRNFFAFVFGKPLVGAHLGQAMIDLQERMHLYRSGRVDNQQDFLDYADAQGYRNFVDCPDYALAILYYAEHFKLRDVWIDAFAHCVGMNERLVLSPEFAPQSRLTKALITRAYLEMDIELGRITRAVRNFLEDDLSPAYLGLTDAARLHLDRFRSFLNSFYVDKFGYWPPLDGTMFSKALYRSLYFDFESLHDYLVDPESSMDFASQRLASGGICVLQNVASFDKRHKFPPLPHPLPLLPNEVASRSKSVSQKSLKTLTLRSKQNKNERYLSACAALAMATNGEIAPRTDSPIIQAYIRFERQCILNHREERVSMADARKVRWLLIYGTLQYLTSALRAPMQVRDSEGPSYYLCCLVAEHSQWQRKANVPPSSSNCSIDRTTVSEKEEADSEVDSSSTSLTAIEPDCQKHDYLFHTNTDPGSRRGSVDVPAPLKISQASRPSSVRTCRRMSLPSLGSIKNSIQLKSQPHCEILVHGYGNGLNKLSQPQSKTSSTQGGDTQRSRRSTLPDGVGPDTSWFRPGTSDSTSSHTEFALRSELRLDCMIIPEPLLGSIQLDMMTTPFTQKPSGSPNSTSSQNTSPWSDGASSISSSSSTYEVQSKSEIAPDKECGLLGGLVSISTPTKTSPKRVSHFTLSRIPTRRSSLRWSLDKSPSKANR